jgi:argininosuccinate lyase
MHVFPEMLRTATSRVERMEKSASAGFANATDCADYLVKHGVPFRDAHAVAGRLVAHCLEKGCALDDLALEELRAFSPAFDQDVYEAISLSSCVAARNLIGGPAPERVMAAVEAGKAWIESRK